MAAVPVHEWPPQELQLFADAIQGIHRNTVQVRRALEDLLAGGVEARSFARDYSLFLPATESHLAGVRELVEHLQTAERLASESQAQVLRSLEAQVRSLEYEMSAYRDLLADALARASQAPRPVDWERIRAAEEAYGRGETKPFARR
jgi:hypothetical protein